MFAFLIVLFAVLGGGVGFLLSRVDNTASSALRWKTIGLGVLGGVLIGAGIWLSFWLLAAAVRLIFWVILLVIAAAVIYFVYRSLKRRYA